MPKVDLRSLGDEMPEVGVERAGFEAYRISGWQASNPYPYLCDDWKRWRDGYDAAETQDLMADFHHFDDVFGEEGVLEIANRMASERQQF